MGNERHKAQGIRQKGKNKAHGRRQKKARKRKRQQDAAIDGKDRKKTG